MCDFFYITPPPPESTLPDKLIPYTTLFRSALDQHGAAADRRHDAVEDAACLADATAGFQVQSFNRFEIQVGERRIAVRDEIVVDLMGRVEVGVMLDGLAEVDEAGDPAALPFGVRGKLPFLRHLVLLLEEIGRAHV